MLQSVAPGVEAGCRTLLHAKRRREGVILIGILAALFLAASTLVADTSVIGRLRQYGMDMQSHVHSTPDGDPANRWSAPGVPIVNPCSAGQSNQALPPFLVPCASAFPPEPPPLQCATLLRPAS